LIAAVDPVEEWLHFSRAQINTQVVRRSRHPSPSPRISHLRLHFYLCFQPGTRCHELQMHFGLAFGGRDANVLRR
jgi:hypothetical protein